MKHQFPQRGSLTPARRIVLAGLFALGIFLSFAAHAAMPLDEWRNQVASVRILAENDAPQAYREAQQLQKAIPAGSTSADRVHVINLLARAELHLGLIGQAAQHAAEARAIARQHNDREGQVEAGLVIALAAINQGRLEDMAGATRDGMDMLAGLEREDLRAEQMFQAAMMYLRFEHMEEAVTVAVSSLDIARNGNNPRAMVYAEYGMAVAYERSGLYDKARENYRRMLDAARQAPSTLQEGNALLGLSTIADHMGDIAGSERLCLEAIALFRRAGGPFYAGHARHVLASLYVRQKLPAKALLLFDENVALYEQRDNPIGLWWTLNGRSTLLEGLGRLDAARRDAERANGLAKKIGFTVYLAGSARRLSELAAAEGDFKQAYRLSAEATELTAKAERENTGRRILDLSRRIQEESKQRQIDELNRHNEQQNAQQRQILIVLASTVALLAVTVFFLLRLRRSREEVRALNVGLEQRVLERTSELYESRQSLAEAQRIAHVGSWDLDLVSNKLTWSDESQRIFEIDPQQVSVNYEVFLDTIHPEDRDAVNRAYLASLENRTPYEIVHRLLFPDGRIKYVHEHCETFYSADGKPLRSIGTTQDITERKEIENALHESRQLLTEAQRIAQVGSWEYDIASDTHTWSDELFRIYEIDPDTEGASYEGCLNATHPDDREAITRAYLNSVETGKSYESEHRLLMADGRIKHVHERCETICGPDGTLLRAVGMMQDITERKLVEQQLKQALEFSEGIINAIPDILFEVDREGRYLNVWTQNPELLAAQKQELLGKTVHEVLSPESAAAAMEAIREADEKGIAIGKVICIDLPHGKSWFEHSLARKPGNTASDTTFLVLSRDITERKRMEESLAAREQEFRSLAESSPDFIVRYDREGRHRYLNYNLVRELGLESMEEVLGKRPIEVWSDGRFSVIEEAAVQAIESGEMKAVELAVPDGKGGLFYRQIFVVPEHGVHGNFIGTIAFGRDVTAFREAERKLKESLEFNEGVINAIPDVLFEVDGEGRYLNVWTHTPELLAAQKEGLLGNTVHDMLSPESAGIVMEALREAEGQGGSFGKTIAVELPQGTSWFELSVSKKSASLSSEATFLLLSRDITERKRMEVALGESEARYRYHFNQLQSMLESSASVSVFALDREYRYLFFNKRHREGAKRIRGTDIAIGMNMVESIPEAEFREFCRQGFDRVLDGNIVSVESKEQVVIDGKPAYEYNDNFGSPIFNDAGEVVGLTVFAINTTERKRLETELRESHNFLNRVIDAVPDPIFVKDRQHRWILLNDANCRFTGLPREALIGKSDYDVFPKEEADVFWEKDELVFDSGEVNLSEESFTPATGEAHFIQTKKTPFVSVDGSQMLVGVIRDITERKHYEAAREAALAEAQRLADLRSEFIAHMSHELRTPLNGILGYAQMLGRDGKLDGKQLASVDVIRQSGEHLLMLIEDILDLARIESGRLELDIGDIPLTRFLQFVAGVIVVRAKQKRLEFACEFSRDLPEGIRGDEKRLRQVLLNLLSNAVKFTDHGKITLTVTRVNPSRLAFAVTDTGIGIAQTDRETIFQSFEQVGDAQHRHGGTGLGLSISRQLVRLMGGDIEVESRVGAGSTFRFELELPETSIEPAVLYAASADMEHVESSGEDEAAEPLAAPPHEEIQALHRLALLGNMRDIAQYAEHIDGLDPRYRPFATRLRKLAEGYQSKAIRAFVEGYLS